jgi:phosphoglycerate dehydrogenase-like enzyme
MHEGAWPRPAGAAGPTSRSLRGTVRGLALPAPVRAALVTADRRLKALRASRTATGTGAGARPGTVAAADVASALRGQVVGLVGWGHTARRFAELLAPFECVILVASESADPDELERAGVRRAGLGELLASAKVVSLHKGLTDRTRDFLGAPQLNLLLPGSVLVNTARGELIDEKALVARLARGDIVAALDVFAEEPLPAKHPLRTIPQAILTPHHASTTAEEERRMGEQALAIVRAWADGAPVDAIARDRLANMT